MKAILFTLFLAASHLSFSQNSVVYDQEWYSSLDQPINFIIFKRTCETTVQFRIYRGNEQKYKVTLIGCNGKQVRVITLNPEDEIDVSDLYHGIYYIKAEDSKGNSITKEIIIG